MLHAGVTKKRKRGSSCSKKLMVFWEMRSIQPTKFHDWGATGAVASCANNLASQIKVISFSFDKSFSPNYPSSAPAPLYYFLHCSYQGSSRLREINLTEKQRDTF